MPASVSSSQSSRLGESVVVMKSIANTGLYRSRVIQEFLANQKPGIDEEGEKGEKLPIFSAKLAYSRMNTGAISFFINSIRMVKFVWEVIRSRTAVFWFWFWSCKLWSGLNDPDRSLSGLRVQIAELEEKSE